jgi:hypothetical protein
MALLMKSSSRWCSCYGVEYKSKQWISAAYYFGSLFCCVANHVVW